MRQIIFLAGIILFAQTPSYGADWVNLGTLDTIQSVVNGTLKNTCQYRAHWLPTDSVQYPAFLDRTYFQDVTKAATISVNFGLSELRSIVDYQFIKSLRNRSAFENAKNSVKLQKLIEQPSTRIVSLQLRLSENFSKVTTSFATRAEIFIQYTNGKNIIEKVYPLKQSSLELEELCAS